MNQVILSCYQLSPLCPKYTTEGKQLSIDTTIFINHSFQDMPVPQNEILESLKCNDYITCCFDVFQCLALIEVVNKEEKDLPCKFLHPHRPSGQFQWSHGHDRGYIPLNKVIMKIQTTIKSASGRKYFITKEEKNKNQNYFDRTSVYMVKFYFFVFDRLLTYIGFDVYFMMQLIKTSKFSWDLCTSLTYI